MELAPPVAAKTPRRQSHAQLPQTLTLQLLGAGSKDLGKPTKVNHFPRDTMSCPYFFIWLPQGTLWQSEITMGAMARF